MLKAETVANSRVSQVPIWLLVSLYAALVFAAALLVNAKNCMWLMNTPVAKAPLLAPAATAPVVAARAPLAAILLKAVPAMAMLLSSSPFGAGPSCH